MVEITLPYPVVLHTPTVADLDEADEKLVSNILLGRKVLKGGTFLNVGANRKEDVKPPYQYGSSALFAARNSGLLGFPLVAITQIYPDDAVALAQDIDGAFDMLKLLGRVHSRTERVKKLMEMNAPLVIMRNEDRMLWESVELLFYNETSVLRPLGWYEESNRDEDKGKEYRMFDTIKSVSYWVDAIEDFPVSFEAPLPEPPIK